MRRERFWTRRVRWRLRGAWLWPAFAIAVVGDALILNRLPPVRTGVDFVPGLILASFGNLFLVGAVAPWIARRLAARREVTAPGVDGRHPPYEVLLSRTSTALLVAGAVGLVASGAATHDLVVSETRATERNAELVERYVQRRGSEEVKANLDSANTVRLSEGYFRTCIALKDRNRAYCMFVDTKRGTVKRDPDERPNSVAIR
jgi:hypothetical protein